MPNRPHYIIDGYNYILRHFHINFDEEDALWRAREQFIHQMIAFLGQKQIRITTVFDGQDLKGITDTHRPAGIKVRFSKAPRKADPLIIDMVKKSKSPQNIIVVTSDTGLGTITKSYGSDIMTSEEFADKIARDRQTFEISDKYETKMSSKELQEWLRLFGESD
jgi:predicted RNA-binding protein with PIN domain